METAWLEDFVVLAETRSFSKSAQIRHVTQPSFSRRIQALEGWVGLDLIDRSTYPPALTPAGEHFYTQAQDLLNRIGYLRLSANELPGQAQETVNFAMSHSLSFSFFPKWLSEAQQTIGAIQGRLRVGNSLDAVLWLVEGGCEILFSYHHPQQPLQLDQERYETLTIGQEMLAPYCLKDRSGRPIYPWPGKLQSPVPLLAYTSSAYLARMTDLAIAQGRSSPYVKRVFDTEMAEGLRRLVLAGHGVAFLPESLAYDDEAQGRLIRLSGGWEVMMQIRAYRERPTLARPASRNVEKLWRWMEQTFAVVTSPPEVKRTRRPR